MRKAFKFWAVCALLSAASSAAYADPALQSFLEQTISAARDKNALPGVAAVVQIDGKIEAEAAIGLRALGRPEALSLNDRWHIGSNTKAITATLIARLVEQKALRFEDPLVRAFPSLAKEMHPDYRNVTIAQLLSHTAGLPQLTDDKELAEYLAASASKKGVRAQRLALTRHYLRKPPASKSGEFSYSNIGYIIAGAIAEKAADDSWENLVRRQIFAPLGIVDAGFGPPGAPGEFDQPRGHKDIEGRLTPLEPGDPGADIPPSLGPAGTINISLRDWLLFAQDHLNGVRGRGKLLTADSYRMLHTPVTSVYALGWGAVLGEGGVPDLLTHSGSNGYWIADIRIMPKRNMIFLVVANAGNESANAAIVEIGKPLRDRLKPFEPRDGK